MEQISGILIGIGILIALAYLPLRQTGHPWLRSLIKTVPLLSFACAAAIANAPAFLTVALLLSAVGDFALSRPGRQAFLYGLSAFALAHVLFALLFVGLSGQALWTAFAVAPFLAITMLIVGFSTEIWLAPLTGSLRWPVRAYIVLIGAMMLAALTLPESWRLVTLGSALFVLSDLILSIRMFRLKETGPWAASAGWAVWVFYIAGQGLISVGILLSLAPPP